jgi:hypothetical protein
VYGMLLSSLTFRLCLLCPTSSRDLSLSFPISFTAGQYVLGVVIALVATAGGMALQKLKNLAGYIAFVILYLSIFFILTYWRLTHTL